MSFKINKMSAVAQSLTIFISLICLASVFYKTNAARILAINPMPFFSHQYFYRPVWNELAAHGHEVVLITAFPMPTNNTNIRQIDVNVVNSMLPRPEYTTDHVAQMIGYAQLVVATAEVVLNLPEIQDLIHNPNQKFDLVVCEFTAPAMFSFKKLYNTPLVLISPFDLMNNFYDHTGSPSHELMYSFFKEIKESPTFFDRLDIFLAWLNEQWRIPSDFGIIDAVGRKFFGDNLLPFREALKQFDLILANVNFALLEVRPFAPSVIPLGGGMFLEGSKHEKLPIDLQHFLDRSTEGVIFVSFGTYVQTMSLATNSLMKLIETFSMLPFKILWKSEPLPKDIFESVNKTGNVYISKWLPQVKVLEHKNVKLVISQGGIQSLEEAIILKKPTIVIPFIGDQHANANRVNNLKLGARVHINTVTPLSLKQTIYKVLGDKEIVRNLEKYSRLLQDQPMKPVERAVWWLEYVLRNDGARHLHAKTLPWWQMLYLDVIFFLIAVFILCVIIFLKLVPVKKLLQFLLAKKIYLVLAQMFALPILLHGIFCLETSSMYLN